MDNIDNEFKNLVEEQGTLAEREAKAKENWKQEWTPERIREHYAALLNKFSGVNECIYLLKGRRATLKKDIRDFEIAHELQKAELPNLRNAAQLLFALWE